MNINLALFIGGLVLFFGAHFFSAFRKRNADGRVLGLPAGPYKGLYSLVSIAGFVAMVWGYAYLKPWIPVWTPPTWTRHIAMTLMLPAVILIVAAYVPTGFIKKAVKHPMLTAVILWSAAHLTANGDLASIMLFGSFFVFSLFDRFAVAERGDQGAAAAQPNILGDLLAIAIGGALYGAIVFYLHYLLFAVPVLLPA